MKHSARWILHPETPADEFGNHTSAIQSLFDACSAAGGGEVRLQPGHYRSAALCLRSGVHLVLEAGAVLESDGSPQAYGFKDGEVARANFLLAENAERIGISGPGIIRGCGSADFKGKDPVRGKLDPEPLFRITTLRLDGCSDVRIENLTIEQSDFWTIHLRLCERVWVRGTAILNNTNRMNSDGIGIDSCRFVHISDCHIVAGDDCITFKATQGFGQDEALFPTSAGSQEVQPPCEAVVVQNCTLETTCTAIKIGTETHGDIRDITVSNCILHNCASGLAIHILDGARVERVSYSNMSYTEREHNPVRYACAPIMIGVGRRYPSSRLGALRDLRIEGFFAASRTGCVIEADVESPIQGLVLRDITLRVNEPMDFATRRSRKSGVSNARFAACPAYFTIARAPGVVVDGLSVEIDPEVFTDAPRSALCLADAPDASLFRITRSPSGEAAPATPVVMNSHSS